MVLVRDNTSLVMMHEFIANVQYLYMNTQIEIYTNCIRLNMHALIFSFLCTCIYTYSVELCCTGIVMNVLCFHPRPSVG